MGNDGNIKFDILVVNFVGLGETRISLHGLAAAGEEESKDGSKRDRDRWVEENGKYISNKAESTPIRVYFVFLSFRPLLMFIIFATCLMLRKWMECNNAING